MGLVSFCPSAQQFVRRVGNDQRQDRVDREADAARLARPRSLMSCQGRLHFRDAGGIDSDAACLDCGVEIQQGASGRGAVQVYELADGMRKEQQGGCASDQSALKKQAGARVSQDDHDGAQCGDRQAGSPSQGGLHARRRKHYLTEFQESTRVRVHENPELRTSFFYFSVSPGSQAELPVTVEVKIQSRNNVGYTASSGSGAKQVGNAILPC